MNDLERDEFDLSMIIPYMNFLKERIARRRTELGKPPEVCFPGEQGGHGLLDELPKDQEVVLFRQPGEIVNGIYTVVESEEQKLARVRDELAQVKYEAQFDDQGNRI